MGAAGYSASRFCRRVGCWLLALTSSCASGAGGRPECLEAEDAQVCVPLYPAEFPVIYRQVLAVTCASAGVSCHGDQGRKGGLAFIDETEAYDALLGLDGGKRRVVPGDPACSEMMVRLDSVGQDWSMPPGAPLDARARCSIRRWIGAGAVRTPAGAP